MHRVAWADTIGCIKPLHVLSFMILIGISDYGIQAYIVIISIKLTFSRVTIPKGYGWHWYVVIQGLKSSFANPPNEINTIMILIKFSLRCSMEINPV